MHLPYKHKVSITCLSRIFCNTTATYKFYWFISILDIVTKEKKRKISFWEIIAGMIAESWYPIHYFKLSFGKADSLYERSLSLQKELNIPIDADKDKIKQTLIKNLDNNKVRNLLHIFTLNVPYRFLSPWISYISNSDIITRSQKLENECLYAINGEAIEINQKWIEYLTEHYIILRDFAFWNLTEFIQKRNPNVPDVPSKLIKPIQRNSLTKQRRFWDIYIETVGEINCIYTGKILFPKTYDLDHFVPWSFVSHDLLWNLIPADSSINSSKSNNLPPLEIFLHPFSSLQQKALKTLYEKNANNPIFEDYLILHNSISDLVHCTETDFYNILKKTFSPIVQIAENMGFKTWKL